MSSSLFSSSAATPELHGEGDAGLRGDGLRDDWPTRSSTPTSQPTRSGRRRYIEVLCGVAIAIMAAWELAMIPVKAYLITHLTLSSVITTDPVAEVGLGARAAFNHHRATWLPVVWAVAVVSTLKWHVVAFWAGTVWGHDALEHWAGRSKRGRRVAQAAVAVAKKAPLVAIIAGYILMPLASLIYAALGAAGLTWRRFLKIDLAASAVATFGWIYLGFYVGRPAEHLLDRYSKYATWVAIAVGVVLVAFVIWRRLTRDSRRIKAEEKQRAQEVAQQRIAAFKQAKQAARQAKAEQRSARSRAFGRGKSRS